ncbi:MAG: Sulfur carrier protein adenylyltransferase ThiF [Gammaproteobacteria bacterium]|jgi:adenylyltransferase/sulfurtransferase|nr:Sulfur carrier protein adenylyltransferase ThiF [Gammaproteobacteria bacterium]
MLRKILLLTRDEIQIYSQQIKLNEIGLSGQMALKKARVLCIGAGGLGSSLLLYLTAAGVGTIGIIDDDIIEPSNLHRQVLYQHAQIGRPKAEMAKQQLNKLNPTIRILAYSERLSIKNAENLFNEYDIIADCSDNFDTRYLINDTSFLMNKPYVFAAVSQFGGQCAIFLAKNSACFRCLFPAVPSLNCFSSCEESGVLGVIPGMFGIIQATEIMKWILKIADTLPHYLFTIDALTMKFQRLHISKNQDCPLCNKL